MANTKWHKHTCQEQLGDCIDTRTNDRSEGLNNALCPEHITVRLFKYLLMQNLEMATKKRMSFGNAISHSQIFSLNKQTLSFILETSAGKDGTKRNDRYLKDEAVALANSTNQGKDFHWKLVIFKVI